MKKLLILITSTLICVSVTAQNQSYRWAMPPKQINFTTANTPVVQNLLPSLSYTACNAATDASGNLLFYMANLNMYSPAGVVIGTLSTTGFYGIIGSSMGIVPVPGACKQYYLLFSLSDYASGVQHHYFCYAKVDASGATPVITQQTTSLQYLTTGTQCASIGFAVSKVNLTASKRFLYLVGTDAYSFPVQIVNRFDITAAGINNKVNIATTSTPGLSGTPFVSEATEVELSPDGTKLAWVTGNSMEVNVIKVNASTGNFVSASFTNVPGSGTCYGLEWNAASSILYTSNSIGLSRMTYPAFAHTTIASSGNYNHTALEMGRNGKIYAVNNTGTGLGEINTTTNVVTASSLVISPGVIDPSSNFYVLPEQIDGEWSQFSSGPAINIADTWMCATPGTSINLNAIPSTYTTYLWEKKVGGGAWNSFGGSGSSTTDISLVNTTIQYRVSATIGGCTTIPSPIATCTYCTGGGCCPAPPVKREINPDQFNETFSSVEMKIQPNPVQNEFSVSVSSEEIETLSLDIFDMNGRLVKSITPDSPATREMIISTEGMSNGLYNVIWNNGANIKLQSKVLVNK